MKKYVGSCIEVDNGEHNAISRYFEDATKMSNFLDMCYKLEMELAVFHVDWNQYELKNLKKDIDEREHDFVAGIYNNYEDGMMYIYDELKDVHYFFI
jgi:hypothetical protein